MQAHQIENSSTTAAASTLEDCHTHQIRQRLSVMAHICHVAPSSSLYDTLEHGFARVACKQYTWSRVMACLQACCIHQPLSWTSTLVPRSGWLPGLRTSHSAATASQRAYQQQGHGHEINALETFLDHYKAVMSMNSFSAP